MEFLSRLASKCATHPRLHRPQCSCPFRYAGPWPVAGLKGGAGAPALLTFWGLSHPFGFSFPLQPRLPICYIIAGWADSVSSDLTYLRARPYDCRTRAAWNPRSPSLNCSFLNRNNKGTGFPSLARTCSAYCPPRFATFAFYLSTSSSSPSHPFSPNLLPSCLLSVHRLH